MAVYTMTLYEIMSSMEQGTMNERRRKLKDWLFSEITVSEKWREEFCEKFLNKYMFDEIGQETPEMFRVMATMYINNRAVLYNRLYDWMQTLAEWDPMEEDIDIWESVDSAEQGTRTESGDREQTTIGTDNTTDDETYNAESDNLDIRQVNDSIYDNTTEVATSNTTSSNTTESTNESITTYNTTVSDTNSNKGLKQTTSEGETANSDFPQGNVNTARDYYSQGSTTGGRVQDKTEANGTAKSTKSGTDRTQGTDNSTSNANSETSDHGSRESNHVQNLQEESNRTGQESGSKSRKYLKLSDISDIIRDIDNIQHEIGRNTTTHRTGHVGRRDIPAIIKSIVEIYQDIPMMLVNDCAELMMRIW